MDFQGIAIQLWPHGFYAEEIANNISYLCKNLLQNLITKITITSVSHLAGS